MNQEGWLNGTLTQEQLKQRLSYDPETGIFRWIGRRDGEIAGFKGNRGYVNITLGRKCYRAHRLAWLYVHGEWPKELIDHINGVRDDNRLSNLRDVTNAVNQQNQQQAQSHNKVGLLGVHWNKKRDKFEATIRVKGKNIFIGRYDDPNEAHAAYLAKKREIHEGAMGAIPHAANCPALEGLPCVCSMPSVPESLGLALTRARVPHAYWRPLINELLPLMQKPTKPEPASAPSEGAVEEAGYTLLSELAGVDTYDCNLRDQPAAYAALDRYRAAVASPALQTELVEASRALLDASMVALTDETIAIWNRAHDAILSLAASVKEVGE